MRPLQRVLVFIAALAGVLLAMLAIGPPPPRAHVSRAVGATSTPAVPEASGASLRASGAQQPAPSDEQTRNRAAVVASSFSAPTQTVRVAGALHAVSLHDDKLRWTGPAGRGVELAWLDEPGPFGVVSVDGRTVHVAWMDGSRLVLAQVDPDAPSPRVLQERSLPSSPERFDVVAVDGAVEIRYGHEASGRFLRVDAADADSTVEGPLHTWTR